MAEGSLAVTEGSGRNIAVYTDSSGNYRQVIVLGDEAGTTAEVPNGVLLTSNGGNDYAVVAASTATNTVVRTGTGRLCKVLITTLGTAAVTFYDNASAASGNVIGYIPASAAAGTVYDFNLPHTSGIVASGNANNPGMTITFINQSLVS